MTSEWDGVEGGSLSESDEYEKPSANCKNKKISVMGAQGKRVTTGIVMGSPVMVHAPFIQKSELQTEGLY